MKVIFVTGGAGFIGSNFTRYLLQQDTTCKVIVIDALTYAGNLANLADLQEASRLEFIEGDICDRALLDTILPRVDTVVNFAAESHVDRSILNPSAFIETNYKGVYTLLEAARENDIQRFLQVSTDEVYGDVPVGVSLESDAFAPRSPYAASKAGAEMLVQSYFTTYNLPTLITRGGNTIGPYQYPEKVVPVFVTNAIENKPLPVYGEGKAIRSYMDVRDHCAGIYLVLQKGEPGEAYNIGTNIEINGLMLVDRILDELDKPKSLRQFVTDRPGHDLRYSLDCRKINALGWSPAYLFDDMLTHAVQWYVEHPDWWHSIKNNQDYKAYYKKQYHER
jgi:dTDP-glucose 4,6-dehydratase